jgi:hypothetical protein
MIRFIATALLVGLAACSQAGESTTADPNTPRTQLSIGYSLLYQEADEIPQLRWIFMFKNKHEEMSRVTSDLVSYYQQLADTMQRLSKQYPAMRIDVAAMSEIEGDARKAIVMLERETDPGLKKFLGTTKAELEAHYAEVGALLRRRYFTQSGGAPG